MIIDLNFLNKIITLICIKCKSYQFYKIKIKYSKNQEPNILLYVLREIFVSH